MNRFLLAPFLLFVGGTALAYNPPRGGNNLLRLSSPTLLSGGASAAGGPFLRATPDSVVNNPALPAFNERTSLQAAGTFFLNSNSGDADDGHAVGSSFELGALVPNNACVPAFLAQGVFAPFERAMDLESNAALTAGLSRDVTDRLAVGASAGFGFFWGNGEKDWMLSLALGAFYQFGDVLFMKDVRVGASVSNIGKMYFDAKARGIDGGECESWPGFATARIGGAATLFEAGGIALGASLDVAFPAFQDFVLDAGVAVRIKDFITVSAAWEFDAEEYSNDAKSLLPSVGVTCKLTLKSKPGSLFDRHGWKQSGLSVSGAWKNLYEDVNAFSLGADIDIGMVDDQPPEVFLWGEK